MKLPEGVSHFPRESQLLAKNEPAIISISAAPGSLNDAYNVSHFDFTQGIEPYLHGGWDEFHQQYPLSRLRAGQADGLAQSAAVFYSVAEHRGDPRQPDIAVVGNLETQTRKGSEGAYAVLGCIAGYRAPTPRAGARVAEVYEFQSYGMLSLDHGAGQVELWVAEPGDKVAVPGGSWATLYNLGDVNQPLIVQKFAGTAPGAREQGLANTYGPILLAYYNDSEVIFRLNQQYLDSPHHNAGVKLSGALSAEECQVLIGRAGRLDLGSFLYNELTLNPDVIGNFARFNLRVKRASREAVLDQLAPGSSRLYFSMPLVDAARQGGEVYRFFFSNAAEAVPGPPKGKGIAAVEEELDRAKRELVRLEKLDRPLMVVVEGAGQWVKEAYRKLFDIGVAKGYDLAVYYANDESVSDRLSWTRDLRAWEHYFNKADPSDWNRYNALNPDVVFVVTPDFTHSDIARWWLGRVPLSPIIFVEKPFDSQVSNVQGLLLDLGRRPGTAVLGLDHYQFYALPIHDLKPEVVEHLGGTLAGVVFYMTEARRIELGRDRTLKFGLTFDLLPHLFALLTYFGDVSTIDDIRVVEAGQYDPLETADKDNPARRENISRSFRNETFSRVRFSFQDYSGNGHHVPCEAAVGKGCKDVKYLEVLGSNGNSVRVDFSDKAEGEANSEYPWKSLFFVLAEGAEPAEGGGVLEIIDPYNRQRTLRVLQQPAPLSLYRSRYEELLDDLVEGESEAREMRAIPSAMLLPECEQVVLALDRTWRAIQATPEWFRYAPGKLDPVQQRQPIP